MCYMYVCFQLVACIREHMWHKAFLMGYSMTLELTLVSNMENTKYKKYKSLCGPSYIYIYIYVCVCVCESMYMYMYIPNSSVNLLTLIKCGKN